MEQSERSRATRPDGIVQHHGAAIELLFADHCRLPFHKVGCR
jgi:hypothetical protein